MFDQMRAMGAIASLMKDREKLADAAERVKTRLEDARVEGVAGGGAIRVTVAGTMRVAGVHIEPAMAAAFSADEQSRLMAQELIAEATNEAMARAQAVARETIAEEAKALGLPEELGAQLGGSFGSAIGL
ncbi:MAG: YbaB/EbfC family nucleoid-associated protein [Phycisphaerales bacterium]